MPVPPNMYIKEAKVSVSLLNFIQLAILEKSKTLIPKMEKIKI